jgi:hypothetical protein
LPFLRQNIPEGAHVSVIPCYLSEEHRVSHGAEVVTAGNAHLLSGSGGDILFETLDRLFPARESGSPNLLKIDVEGYEARVFAGGGALLRRDRPAIFMEWHPLLLLREGFEALAPLDLLIASGFTDTIVYDNHGFLVGNFPLNCRNRLEQLARYARLRERFYFDLAVFSPSHAGLHENFLASEIAFYESWLRSGSG